jgi:hypothetical protein
MVVNIGFRLTENISASSHICCVNLEKLLKYIETSFNHGYSGIITRITLRIKSWGFQRW